MKKRISILALAGVLCLSSSFPALAAWEQQTDNSWKFKNDETGVFVTSQWIESQSEKGVWYYLDETGVMVTDTVIDGFYIDGNGEWREGSQQQTQPTQPQQSSGQTGKGTGRLPSDDPANKVDRGKELNDIILGW